MVRFHLGLLQGEACFNGCGEFSDGYNLHWFSDAIGLALIGLLQRLMSTEE